MSRGLLRHCAKVNKNGSLTLHRCILISGLSGSGKTTVGKLLEGWTFIDGDDFFLPHKPKVKLSNGETVSNWDCPEAIDWKELNITVKQKLLEGNVVFVTFLPMIEKYEFVVDYHVRLYMGEGLVEKCLAARIASKNIKSQTRIQRDQLVVQEYVIPMYMKMSERDVDASINVYDGSIRKNPSDLAKEITRGFHDPSRCCYVCAACLGSGNCLSCQTGRPIAVVKTVYNCDSEKWMYGQPFARIDEQIQTLRQVPIKKSIVQGATPSATPVHVYPCKVTMYLCAECRGEKRSKNSTNCKYCETDDPKMIVSWIWFGNADIWEHSPPFRRTSEWVAMR
ncbi:Hypothetical protein POVR1_LOCUS428 [uncultured virus]|nr:Hypothetical protein POVR1_LOCUS428 [uncultured virus]